LVAN